MRKVVWFIVMMFCGATALFSDGEVLAFQERENPAAATTPESTTEPRTSGGDAEMEAKFIAMLKNATLKGTWAPVQQGQLGMERGDGGYRIARVEKKEGDKWSVIYAITFRERTVEFPIAATVKFAGDTSVLILDNVRAGRGQANWSARVMFHDDVYVGRWWETSNTKHGGTISGTITRAASDSNGK